MEKGLQPNSYSLDIIVTFALTNLNRISYNVLHVCDVAPSPTRARGHVAERRAAAPRSPRRPAGTPMHIRAVIRSCAIVFIVIFLSEGYIQKHCRFLNALEADSSIQSLSLCITFPHKEV